MQTTETGKQGKGLRVMSDFWRTLGIDANTTPNETTLGEIGIESMFAAELQQQLQRECKRQISLTQFRRITIGILKEYEKGNGIHIDHILDK